MVVNIFLESSNSNIIMINRALLARERHQMGAAFQTASVIASLGPGKFRSSTCLHIHVDYMFSSECYVKNMRNFYRNSNSKISSFAQLKFLNRDARFLHHRPPCSISCSQAILFLGPQKILKCGVYN